MTTQKASVLSLRIGLAKYDTLSVSLACGIFSTICHCMTVLRSQSWPKIKIQIVVVLHLEKIDLFIGQFWKEGILIIFS